MLRFQPCGSNSGVCISGMYFSASEDVEPNASEDVDPEKETPDTASPEKPPAEVEGDVTGGGATSQPTPSM